LKIIRYFCFAEVAPILLKLLARELSPSKGVQPGTVKKHEGDRDMQAKILTKAALATASAGALFAVLGASPAAAAPINFTWDPALTGISTQGPITANDITLSDYAAITIDPTNLSDVVENAILPIANFTEKSTPVTLTGTPFSLYFKLTSISTLSAVPTSSNVVTGYLTSLSYTLYGVAGTCAYSAAVTGVVSATCGGTPVALATGSLAAGPGPENQVAILDGVPFATAETNIVAVPAESSFFVSPTDLTTLEIESSFTNTFSVATLTANASNQPVVLISGGGGNADVVVPEPYTVATFGFGLLGLGWFARRRANKS
jgi:hypothetical protein